MRTSTILFSAILIFASVSSCSSIRTVTSDDVYSMEAPLLPIGENLLDETSYATFRYRKEMENPVAGYFNPNNQSNNSNRFNQQMMMQRNFMMFGNFGFDPWGRPFMFSPNMHNMHWNSMGMFGPMGMNNNMWMHGHMGMNGFGGFNNFNHFNNFNQFNNFNNFNQFNNFNNSFAFYNQTGGFFGNNFNNFGGNFDNQNSRRGNFVSGPRQTSSGYYSGRNIGGSQQMNSPLAPGATGGTAGKGTNIQSASQRNQSVSTTRPVSSNTTFSRPESQNQTRVNTATRTAPTRTYSNGAARSVEQRSSPTPQGRVINSPSGSQNPRGTYTPQSRQPQRSNTSVGGGTSRSPMPSSSPSSSPSRSPSPASGGGRRN